MGRKPIIREAILDAIKSSPHPLRFSQIKREVSRALDRRIEEVRDQNISYNLSILTKNGQVEKASLKGKMVYSLSNSYYKAKNKALIKSILDSTDLEEFYPRFEKVASPPLTAYFNDLDAITNPLRKRVVQYFVTGLINWSNPLDIITRRMLESFMDLPMEERNGVKRLLMHSYWYGVLSLVREFGAAPLNDILSKNKNFAAECIENAKKHGDSKRIEAENTLIEILDITQEILSKENLNELLIFFQQQNLEIKKLQSRLLSLFGEFMGGGEKIFDSFSDFHSRTLAGLKAAKLLPEGRMRGLRFPGYRYLLSFGDVWNEVIISIIREFNAPEDLESVNGNLEQTLIKIKEHKKYIWSLITLPLRSKMFVVYLWGYPEIFEVSDKDFLPMFVNWMSALKQGYLDHRSWIFSEKTVTALIKALKAVRRDKAPPEGVIDLEPWTIKDLYQYHPRGKDVDFWKELLIELNLRMQRTPKNRELCRHISAALEGRY